MRVLIAIVCFAAAARASSISDELSVSNSQSTPSSPRSGTLADSLNMSFDVSEHWSIDFGALITHEDPTPMPAPISFKNFTNDPFELFTAGVDWEVGDHWTLGASAEFSPNSTQSAVPQFNGVIDPFNGRRTIAYLLVNSSNDEWGARLDAGYDTAGDSDLEWSFNGSVSFSANSIDQTIPGARYDTGNGTYRAATLTELRTACSTDPLHCSKVVQAAMIQAQRNGAQPLDFEKFSPAATATISRNTDLTLSGDYYLYNQDPTTIGVPSVALRQLLGNGLALAPLHYLIRPEILQRWGGFSARLWLQAGRYMPGTGQSMSGLGLKLQYKFTKAFRLWATISGQRDIDVDGTESQSGSFALGAGYRF